MKAISLFSGVGGFDLGLERAGMDITVQVEVDKFCQQVLRRWWPGVELYDDVRKVGADELGGGDLICGGFPCQDLSVAGNREGLSGERSGLFYEFMRVVRETRPTWVLIENVPGLLSSNGGRDMGAVLGTLAELGYGYTYRVLDTQYFGPPQRRRRLFIVAHSSGVCPPEVLFEPEGVPWDSAPSREPGEGTTHPTSGSLAASGRGTARVGESRGQDPVVMAGGQANAEVMEEGCPTLNTNGEQPIYAGQCHGSNVGAFTGLRRGNGHVTGGVPFVASDYANGQYEEAERSRPITGSADRTRAAPIVTYRQSGHGWWDADKKAEALRSWGGDAGGGSETLAVKQVSETLRVGGRDQGAGDGPDNTPVTVQAVNVEHGLNDAGNMEGKSVLQPLTKSERKGHTLVYSFHSNRGQDGAMEDVSPVVRVGSGVGIPSPPAVSVHGQRSHCLKGRGCDASEDGTGRGTPIVAPTIPASGAGTSRPGGPGLGSEEKYVMLSPKWKGAVHTTGHQGDRAVHPDDRASTLPAQGGNNGGGPAQILGASVPRRLTPTECERLQGFPDQWTAVGVDPDAPADKASWWMDYAGAAPEELTTEVSDTQRYKMMGNAVSVPVAHWIALRILAVEHGGDPDEAVMGFPEAYIADLIAR